MARNVEIKARVADLDLLEPVLERLQARFDKRIQQEDTFYRMPWGRLKLRIQEDQPAELIFYLRADQAGPKTSRYWRWTLKSVAGWRGWLRRFLGIRGIVRKTRTLWMFGQTRIHLDQVEGLGSFIEFEVVLHEDQSLEEGQQMADRLMQELSIPNDQLCRTAYIDMIRAQTNI